MKDDIKQSEFIFILGFSIGCLGTLIGIGGGIIHVPLLGHSNKRYLKKKIKIASAKFADANFIKMVRLDQRNERCDQ
ncbi:MAG: hypothetical protein V4596_10775 [Bdellovibrionota bacterium]